MRIESGDLIGIMSQYRHRILSVWNNRIYVRPQRQSTVQDRCPRDNHELYIRWVKPGFVQELFVERSKRCSIVLLSVRQCKHIWNRSAWQPVDTEGDLLLVAGSRGAITYFHHCLLITTISLGI